MSDLVKILLVGDRSMALTAISQSLMVAGATVRVVENPLSGPFVDHWTLAQYGGVIDSDILDNASVLLVPSTSDGEINLIHMLVVRFLSIRGQSLDRAKGLAILNGSGLECSDAKALGFDSIRGELVSAISRFAEDSSPIAPLPDECDHASLTLAALGPFLHQVKNGSPFFNWSVLSNNYKWCREALLRLEQDCSWAGIKQKVVSRTRDYVDNRELPPVDLMEGWHDLFRESQVCHSTLVSALMQ